MGMNKQPHTPLRGINNNTGKTMKSTKKTPEQQNHYIKTMTSIYTNGDAHFAHRCKIKPQFCEHCNWTMTKTGNLPAIDDAYSWHHWLGVTVCDDIGIRKVHPTSEYGLCCTNCAKFWQLSIVEEKRKAKAEGRYCNKTGAIYSNRLKPTI